MKTKMPQGLRARKARALCCLSPDNQVHSLPLRAVLPGARAGLTVRGPGAVEWVAFLEGRAA
jgi:hypothetical protein